VPITIPPGLLARYPFVRVLGQGAFAAVYLADQPALGRQVVVKVLGDAKADSVKRFEREAQVIAKLQHPGVIQLLDFGEIEGCRFLVEPFETEDTLQAVLARRGRLPWREAARVALEITQALEHVHGRGIVHRDLKPANVLMTADGRPRLVDFGVAFVADSSRLTATNASVGTPVYMAPELIRAEPVTASADLYAVGVLLYELIAGENPFHSTDLREVIEKQLNVPVESLPPVDPPVPPSLVALVVQLLAKTPERRPADAADLGRRLAEVLAEREDAAPRSAPESVAPEPESEPPRPLRVKTARDRTGKHRTKSGKRFRVTAFAAAGIAALLAVGVGVLWSLATPARVRTAPASAAPASSSPLELAAEEAVQAWGGQQSPQLDGFFRGILLAPPAQRTVLFQERMAAHPLVKGLSRLAGEPDLPALTARLGHRPQLVSAVLDAAAELSRAQLFAGAQTLAVPPSLDLLQKFPGTAMADSEPRSAPEMMVTTGEISLDATAPWSRTIDVRTAPGRRLRLVTGVKRITNTHAYVRATLTVTRPADRAVRQVANLYPLSGGRDREWISVDLRRELADAKEVEVKLEIALVPGSAEAGRIEVGPMELLSLPGQ
jgi:tRNA A-37 threonylcarbamoyl transferase component Bud32